MTEINHPILETKKIIKATCIALLLAIIILIIAVLPAEYGIDPTGLGKTLGFAKLHQPEAKIETTTLQQVVEQPSRRVLKLEKGGSSPDVKRPVEANNPPPAKQLEERQDSINITIPAGEDLEYKIDMLKYGTVKYEWLTSKGTVFFDFHGEVKEANPTDNVYYESYTVAYSNNIIGNFLSPFEGKHGWYFKNSNDTTITISIRLKGQYTLRN